MLVDSYAPEDVFARAPEEGSQGAFRQCGNTQHISSGCSRAIHHLTLSFCHPTAFA
jgi:hypothetical protein